MTPPVSMKDFLRYCFVPTSVEQHQCRIPHLLRRTLIGALFQLLIIIIIIYLVYHYICFDTKIASILVSIPIYCIAIVLISIILLTMMEVIREAILYELNEFYGDKILRLKDYSNENCEWFIFLTQRIAMIPYKDRIDDICSICLCSLNDNDISSKYVLECGHIHHIQCLDLYENKQRIHHQTPYYRQCPICKRFYHLLFSKFVLNENYYDTLSILYKPIPECFKPIQRFIEHHFWDKIICVHSYKPTSIPLLSSPQLSPTPPTPPMPTYYNRAPPLPPIDDINNMRSKVAKFLTV